jgi:glutamate/aspartate transport system permease protein
MPDLSVLIANAAFLADGMILSLNLTIAGVSGGLIAGTILVSIRMLSGRIINRIVDAYVFLFRAIPLVLVIFWFYFLVPVIVGRPVGAYVSVVIAFILFEGAYYSEIIRAGIRSIRSGQMNAAAATGMSRLQALRYVIFPQAFRVMVPVFLTQAIVLFQDTSLVFVVSLHDLLTATTVIANNSHQLLECYGAACLIYYVICLCASGIANQLRGSSAHD